MKNNNPLGFIDEYVLLVRLTKLKDPLVILEKLIDWNIFRTVNEIAFKKPANLIKMGRPPFDRTMMFKFLVPQSLYILPRLVWVRWNIRLPIGSASSDFWD